MPTRNLRFIYSALLDLTIKVYCNKKTHAKYTIIF